MATLTPHVGDRLERSVGRHLDVRAELRRRPVRRLRPRRLARTAVWLVVCGVFITLVAPEILGLTRERSEVEALGARALAGAALLQAAAVGCLAALHRLMIAGASWRTIFAAELSGNALSSVTPGSGAAGPALQHRMLVRSGVGADGSMVGLTAARGLTFAVATLLPCAAILAAIAGGLVPSGVLSAAGTGLVAFVALTLVGAACFAWDGPPRALGIALQLIRNRLRPRTEPIVGLPAALLTRRDEIRDAAGFRWPAALLAAVARSALDFASLLVILAALGVHPRPALILLAFCCGKLLSQVPITPGGLGFVEAGMTLMLTLAGVPPGPAALATFTYRLLTYWLVVPVGLVAYLAAWRADRRPAQPAARMADAAPWRS